MIRSSLFDIRYSGSTGMLFVKLAPMRSRTPNGVSLLDTAETRPYNGGWLSREFV